MAKFEFCNSTQQKQQFLQFYVLAHFEAPKNLLRDILEGTMLGKATRSRKQLRMISDISINSHHDLKREAEERSSWKMMLSKT